jgi:hypothetical protein
MRIACWITKATDKNTQNIKYLLFFHGNNGYAKAPQYCLIDILTLLFLYLLRFVTSIHRLGWWRALIATTPGVVSGFEQSLFLREIKRNFFF